MAKNLANGLCFAYGAKITNQGAVRSDGFYQVSTGDRVTYLFGHMIEMAPVSAYISREQNMNLAGYFSFLPLFPAEFKFLPKADLDKDGKPRIDRTGVPVVSAHFKNLIQLLKKAPEIVNAGDIDREGQLIVDELLDFAGIDPGGRDKPIWRFSMVSPKDEDIKRQLLSGPLELNSLPKWRLARDAAYSRMLCDWLLGMNASMSYQAKTNVRGLSIGRVQTPTLNLVVQRDLLIENFKPRQYFVPVITLRDGTQMRWHKRDGAEGQPGFDSEGRIIDRAVADKIVFHISKGLQGTVTNCEQQHMKELPPLPFSLGTLQAQASREHGLTLKEVSKVAQALYEKHKMISYVGTDCQFLPESMLENSRTTITALAGVMPRQANGANMSLRSKAWNDNKVDEHYAIIPTGVMANGLSEDEKSVFGTIARRYISQFYPAYEFMKNSLHADFGGDEFRATSRQDVRMGWKEVEKEQKEGTELTDTGDSERDRDLHVETYGAT